ncbi:MAG: transketolase C-terminal domain-containing protein [Pseudomonadota bacterium]
MLHNTSMSNLKKSSPLRQLSYSDALFEALDQEMTRDECVFVYGQGADDPKGHYATTLNLHQKYGPARCFDTPLAEESMLGIGIGAAMAGLRPVNIHQRVDFLMVCMNQLVNIAAKQHYISAGALRVPLTIRACIGRSWGQGAQHSQSLYSMFAHIPGLIVLAPVTAHDAKASLIAAIRNDNPVIIIEHRLLYPLKGHVYKKSDPLILPFIRRLHKGDDLTIVAVSHAAIEATRATQALAKLGIKAELLNPVSISPLDCQTIAQSFAKTKRLLMVDNDWLDCGLSAEIMAKMVEHGLGAHPMRRLGFAQTPCPTTHVLENAFYPNGQSILKTALELCELKPESLPTLKPALEIDAFRGPF